MRLLDPRTALEYSISLPLIAARAELLAKEAVEIGDDVAAARFFAASERAESFFQALLEVE